MVSHTGDMHVLLQNVSIPVRFDRTNEMEVDLGMACQ